MEYYLAAKKEELVNSAVQLLIHTATWVTLTCILLSEKGQTRKVTYIMITNTWHSGKGKTIGIENR